jgi:hypothetical protein
MLGTLGPGRLGRRRFLTEESGEKGDRILIERQECPATDAVLHAGFAVGMA